MEITRASCRTAFGFNGIRWGGGRGGKMRNQDSHLARHRESRSVARDQRTLLREFNAPHGCCWLAAGDPSMDHSMVRIT